MDCCMSADGIWHLDTALVVNPLHVLTENFEKRSQFPFHLLSPVMKGPYKLFQLTYILIEVLLPISEKL